MNKTDVNQDSSYTVASGLIDLYLVPFENITPIISRLTHPYQTKDKIMKLIILCKTQLEKKI